MAFPKCPLEIIESCFKSQVLKQKREFIFLVIGYILLEFFFLSLKVTLNVKVIGKENFSISPSVK